MYSHFIHLYVNDLSGLQKCHEILNVTSEHVIFHFCIYRTQRYSYNNRFWSMKEIQNKSRKCMPSCMWHQQIHILIPSSKMNKMAQASWVWDRRSLNDSVLWRATSWSWMRLSSCLKFLIIFISEFVFCKSVGKWSMFWGSGPWLICGPTSHHLPTCSGGFLALCSHVWPWCSGQPTTADSAGSCWAQGGGWRACALAEFL